MSKKSREEYEWILRTMGTSRELLAGKSEALSELYKMCDGEQQLQLISNLIRRFDYIDPNRYATLLAQMASHIKAYGYPGKEISVVSMAIDSDADSSQAILQDLKVSLAQEFGHKIHDCNKFCKDDLGKNYTRGCRNFIAVDEFAGTGSTIVERYNRFLKMNFRDATIDFCIMSGMADAINHVRAAGINIKVFNILNKGISDYESADEARRNIDAMLLLESKLAERIMSTKLTEHSLGFRQSESLYYKFNGNIPNNVFPLFWWKEYAGNKARKPLFTRVQKGY